MSSNAEYRLKVLPPPDKQGVTEDNWNSRIWTRGSHAMKFRFRENEFEVQTFENLPGVGLKDRRFAVGSLDFCVNQAKRWFRERSSAAPAGSVRAAVAGA